MPNWTGGRLSSNFAYHSPDFLNRSATIDFRYKGLPGFARLVDFIVRLVLARMIRRFSILAGVGHVFTFRVAFLLLRMEFMHSSFSQTGSRFFDRGLLLGIVLLAILVRMSVKCSIGSSRSLE